ncbi:hypothetical protein CSA56_09530 [candidate division KSB3 bacterium]|uniref:Probable membrane transporter protein n=1 Tax=candidate division KSB3 bacterium TaxID=2044937 RepID=A0A2G6KEV7_9BACT|nr:MAG: hypothetical protein CSA56_09530 [candidate division KSB3 bacterium]
MHITYEMFGLLFLGGLCAGFVDSIAGGGGLIALPVILSLGLPTPLALGTNKLQGSFGTASASYNYFRKGNIRFQECYVGIIFTLVGAAIGTWTIQQLDPEFLTYIIPVLLLVIFIHTLFSPKLGYVEQAPKMSPNFFFTVFGLILGFYDGFFGPGTGAFWIAALLVLGGFNMTKAVGLTRIMNFISNIVALCLFAMGGNILYSAGLCMALGQIVGAHLGSNLAMRRGAHFIRPIFLIVVFFTLLKILYTTLTSL